MYFIYGGGPMKETGSVCPNGVCRHEGHTPKCISACFLPKVGQRDASWIYRWSEGNIYKSYSSSNTVTVTVTSTRDFLKYVDFEINAFIRQQSGVHGHRHFNEQVLLLYFKTVNQVNHLRNFFTFMSFNYCFEAWTVCQQWLEPLILVMLGMFKLFYIAKWNNTFSKIWSKWCLRK